MEFRVRDYTTEQESRALLRSPADTHPLSSPPLSHNHQEDAVEHRDNDFFDPLRGPETDAAVSIENFEDASTPTEVANHVSVKEWISFKRFLMQRFPVSKMVSISSMSDVIIKGGEAYKKSSTSLHLDELDVSLKISEEGSQVIARQEYLSRLHGLKDEINRAWHTEDRVTSLKLSIKVTRLLMDTSVLQFYPTLFVLVTDLLDMLGDMVWERIKQKAEFSQDGALICSLPENFEAKNICTDAKETCYNWFCKVGSIRELLPRIYLELAILPCGRFLLDQPADSLQRLVMMARGIGDPLASAYCKLYLFYSMYNFGPNLTGYLVTCVNDIKAILMRVFSSKATTFGHFTDKSLLVSLMEPTIGYIMKCLFKEASQAASVLVDLGLGRNQVELFGNIPYVSVVLHHLLKELPIELVCSYAVEILHVIKSSNDDSFDQCLNYRLLGLRLSEMRSQVGNVNDIVDEVLQVVSQYDKCDEYLKIVDTFLDIVLQYEMDNHLSTILDGISKRIKNEEIADNELARLQSILVKLLSHFKDLADVIALNHFLEILDVMHGNWQSNANMHILNTVTRNGYIRDPTIIQLLFEVSQALHDEIDFANVKDDKQRSARLISCFVQMVDYGAEWERHLTFLVECREAFGNINELKETLVHSSNCLATKAMKRGSHMNFVRSCMAFSEVTIPSISSHIRQLNLYIETAEVALFGGLVSHLDGLLDSAIDCLQNASPTDALRSPTDVDGLVSSIRKLLSLLVMVPGNPDKGVMYIPKDILSVIRSQSWMTVRMKTRIFCGIVLLLAALSQRRLPYHAGHAEIMGNDYLFFGDSSYVHELTSLTEVILQNLVDMIEQEPSRVVRGSTALEACNCIATALKTNHNVSLICSKLIETAKLCLNTKDKYLQCTIKFLDRMSASSVGTRPLIL
ncbi:UPF0505 protein C16orf62 homolog [Carica papaya]|uniref:UPF0505 protein C16orf62 homolog n=1 Tax=Carica papaya TaxID=3649 RepID=UPI000B8CD103|nr:UPF0505 protein C16orf62 homolog [Carica papaya]